jgi:undecaprenyl-diphosphatase
MPMPDQDYLIAGLLGIVEGLTEFLPVSSTGHLILADALLGIEGPASKLFDIVIQLGAILAVCWVYRERFSQAVGVLAHRLIKEVLFSPWVVAVSLIVGGILILVIERARPPPRIENVDDMRMRTAFGIGCCQILAMVPGVSRAGATIMGGLMLGVDRPAATQFSFFLAVPTMLGAAVYDLYKNRAIVSLENGTMIAIGFVVAFICALFVVRTLVGFVSRHGFGVFAWYRIALGGLALALLVLLR